MTWWGKLGGLMAACLLSLLVVAPTVSMAACLCDYDVAIVGVEAVAIAVLGDPEDHGAPCDAACCVSGHCHHGGGMLDAPVAAVPALVSFVSEHVMAAPQALASRTLSGPDRPPRI
jgi:hypothetical protein